MPSTSRWGNLDPAQVPPRNPPVPFREWLTGLIGETLYGVPVAGPALLGLGDRLRAGKHSLMEGTPYAEALEGVQTGQEQFRREQPRLSESAQAAGQGLLAPAFGASVPAQMIGNAALSGADAMVRGQDPGYAAGEAALAAVVPIPGARRALRKAAAGIGDNGGPPIETWKDPISSVKLRQPLEQFGATYAPAPGQNLQDVVPFDFKNLKEGDYIVPFLGDRSSGEGLLTGVSGTKFRKPVLQEGGSDYLRRPGSPLWASDPGVISKYQNIIRRLQGLKGAEKGDIWGATVGMGPQSLDYSVQSVRTMMQQLKKRPLSAEAKKVFDQRMREEWTDFKGYENWPGIDKVSDKWWRLAGSARTKAMKLMDTKQMRDLGGPDVAAARWANTHPELRGDIPFLGTGHGWTKVGPGDVQSVIDPEDWHSSYRAKLLAPGSEYAGRSRLIPGEKAFADWGEGAQGLKDTSQKQKSFTTKKVYQRLTSDVLQGIADYLASPEGMKLGIAGAIAAGLLTAEEAMGLAGMRGGSERSEQRPAA